MINMNFCLYNSDFQINELTKNVAIQKSREPEFAGLLLNPCIRPIIIIIVFIASVIINPQNLRWSDQTVPLKTAWYSKKLLPSSFFMEVFSLPIRCQWAATKVSVATFGSDLPWIILRLFQWCAPWGMRVNAYFFMDRICSDSYRNEIFEDLHLILQRYAVCVLLKYGHALSL